MHSPAPVILAVACAASGYAACLVLEHVVWPVLGAGSLAGHGALFGAIAAGAALLALVEHSNARR